MTVRDFHTQAMRVRKDRNYLSGIMLLLSDEALNIADIDIIVSAYDYFNSFDFISGTKYMMSNKKYFRGFYRKYFTR